MANNKPNYDPSDKDIIGVPKNPEIGGWDKLKVGKNNTGAIVPPNGSKK